MYVKGGNRSFNVLGDAARMSPCGKTHQVVKQGRWVVSFGASVGGTPTSDITLIHTSHINIQCMDSILQ